MPSAIPVLTPFPNLAAHDGMPARNLPMPCLPAAGHGRDAGSQYLLSLQRKKTLFLSLGLDPAPDERRDGRSPGSPIVACPNRLPGPARSGRSSDISGSKAPGLQLRAQRRTCTGFPLHCTRLRACSTVWSLHAALPRQCQRRAGDAASSAIADCLAGSCDDDARCHGNDSGRHVRLCDPKPSSGLIGKRNQKLTATPRSYFGPATDR